MTGGDLAQSEPTRGVAGGPARPRGAGAGSPRSSSRSCCCRSRWSAPARCGSSGSSTGTATAGPWCTCRSAGLGRAAHRRGAPPRPHHRVVARVQHLRAIQRRQLVPGRHLRPAREPRCARRCRAALKAGRGSTTSSSRCRPASGSNRSRPGSAASHAAARSRSCRARATTRCDPLYEPTGVSNLEGLVRPDTYKISESQDEIAILQTMVTAFDTREEARAHRPMSTVTARTTSSRSPR